MEKKKMDQRVRLTRNLLKNALVQLMQQQHLDAEKAGKKPEAAQRKHAGYI